MGIQTRQFLRQDRLKPRLNRELTLEDVTEQPSQEDVSDDYADGSVLTGGGFQPPQQGMPYVPPDDQQTETALPLMSAKAVGFNEATAPTEQPSNRRRALAQSLLEQGSQPFKTGAGWWGVADRLAATGVGAWMDSRETDREEGAKKGALNEFLSSLDETDPVHRFAKTVAMQGDVNKATDLILRHETQKEIAKMRAANSGTGYRQRNRKDGAVEHFETSMDGGATWKEVSHAPVYKPVDPNANQGLLPGFASNEEQEDALNFSVQMALAGKYDQALKNSGSGKDKTRFVNMFKARLQKAMKERGMDGVDFVASMEDANQLGASMRALGVRLGKLDVSANEVEDFANYAIGASNKTPRGDWKFANDIRRWINGQRSDPNQAEFNMWNLALASAAAVVAGRGEVNQAMQEEFRHKLDNAIGPQAYKRAVQTVQMESRRMRAIGEKTMSDTIHAYKNRQRELANQGLALNPDADEASSPTQAAPPETKVIPDPENPGKKITIIRQPDGTWAEQ